MNTWTDANGVETRIRDLDDQHLVNIIRWLERTTFAAGGGSGPDDFWYEETDGTDHECYVPLLREAVRRGLKV